MAKRLLLGVLQDYFGRYIDGLNEENLKVAVWAGEINLESLELKKDILDALRLPLEIQCGHIHRFSVHVPWTKLGSEPVRVFIDGVYVLARACSYDEHKKNTETRKPVPRSVAEKRMRLKWARLLAGSGAQEAKGSFWSRMGAKILDNLQVNITNVHLRYEDELTVPNRCFSIGVTFEQFTGFTCNSEGCAVFVQRDEKVDMVEDKVHKNIKFKSLAAYWDTNKRLFSNSPDKELMRSESDFVYLLSRDIWRLERDAVGDPTANNELLKHRNIHNFILLPCSPQMLVTKTESADFSKPLFHAQINFDTINCLLSMTQFEMITILQGVMESNSVLQVYREHRPQDSPLENPGAWWKYAYICVKINNLAKRFRKRHTAIDSDALFRLAKSSKGNNDWSELVRQVTLREEYIGQYKLIARAEYDKPDEPMPNYLLQSIQEMEDEFPVESTLAYRATAVAQVGIEQKKLASEDKNKNQSRLWRMTGWLAGEVSNSSLLTDEEQHEILEAIDFFEQTKTHSIPDGTVYTQVHVTMKDWSLSLIDFESQNVLYSSCASGVLDAENRFGGQWSTNFCLHDFTFGDHTIKDSLYETFLSSKDKDALGNLIQLDVCYSPVTSHSRDMYKIRMVTAPFKIIILPSMVHGLTSFFRVGIVAHKQNLENIALLTGRTHLCRDSFDDDEEKLSWVADFVKQKSTEQLQSSSTAFDIRMNIAAPLLVFPSLSNNQLILLDLGHLLIDRSDENGKIVEQAWHQQENSDDQFFDALENELADDESLRSRTTTNDLREIIADALVSSRIRPSSQEPLHEHGTWRMDIRKIKGILLVVPEGKAWEQVLQESEVGITYFRILEEFDVSFHAFGNMNDQAVEVTLKHVQCTITPNSLKRFHLMHEEWNSKEWWWSAFNEDINIVDNEEQRKLFLEKIKRQSEKKSVLKVGVYIHHIQLNIGTDPEKGSPQHLYLIGNLHFLQSEFVQRAGGSSLNLELGSFDVFDTYANQENGTYFVSSGENSKEKLITFEVRWRARHEAEMLISAIFKFDQLQVFWNPDTIYALQHLFRKITDLRNERSVTVKSVHDSNSFSSQDKPMATKYTLLVSLRSISIHLIKRDQILAQITVVDIEAKISQSVDNFILNGHLGNLKLTGSKQQEVFSVVSENDALITFRYKQGLDSELFLEFSASRYFHLNLFYCELSDYLSEGVFGIAFNSVIDEKLLKNAIAYESSTDASWTRFEISLKQFELFIPSSIESIGVDYLAATCSDLFIKSDLLQKKTIASLGGLDIFTDVDSILKEPVTFNLSFWRTSQDALIVEGNVSDINVALAQGQYWLLQHVFSDNLLADPAFESSELLNKTPSQINLNENIKTVEYFYEEDGPATVFTVDIKMAQASLALSHGVNNANTYATFSMQEFCLLVYRDDPDECTSIEIRVRSLDLVDNRPESEATRFIYLIRSNPRSGEENFAFVFRYTHSERKIGLELVNFKSILMLDLLFDVIGFWVSSDEDEIIPVKQEKFIDPDELTIPWRGNFDIINPSLCLVQNFDDPESKMVVVKSDISFTWDKNGNRSEKDYSYWRGTFQTVEAYVASTSGKHDDEIIMHQILEPTAMNFSYEREQAASDSKIHSRRVNLKFGQFECYFSIQDISMIGDIASNITGRDATKEIQITPIKPNTMYAIKATSSERTLTGSDDEEEEEIIYFPPITNDINFIEFTVPAKVVDTGFILQQDHGFLRVHSCYATVQGPSICTHYGVSTGDFLLSVDNEFVCNESLSLIQERLVCGKRPMVLKFLRSTSDEPVILQDYLSFSTNKFICNFIDDVQDGNMPLANVVLSTIDCFVNSSNEGNSIYGSQVDVTGAHFFDLRAGSWGVLLDPCNINVSSTVYCSGEMELSIDIAKPITVNLSDTFIRMMHNTLAGPPAQESKTLLMRTMDPKKNHAFLLCNKTGLALRFWDLAEDKAMFVNADCEDAIAFGFPHHKGGGGSFYKRVLPIPSH